MTVKPRWLAWLAHRQGFNLSVLTDFFFHPSFHTHTLSTLPSGKFPPPGSEL